MVLTSHKFKLASQQLLSKLKSLLYSHQPSHPTTVHASVIKLNLEVENGMTAHHTDLMVTSHAAADLMD